MYPCRAKGGLGLAPVTSPRQMRPKLGWIAQNGTTAMGRVAVPAAVAGACFTTPPPRWAGAKAGDKRSGYTVLRDSTTVEAIMATSAAAIQIHCVPCAWNFSPRTT